MLSIVGMTGALTLIMLDENLSRDFAMFFLFFPENRTNNHFTIEIALVRQISSHKFSYSK